MPSLDPSFAGEVAFERCTDQANNTWVPLLYQPSGGKPAVENTPAVVSLAAPTPAAGNGPRYTQGGTVFVPRGIDRRNGDRFTYDDAKYYLIGKPRGDQDHPITGEDYGWVAFTFTGSG